MARDYITKTYPLIIDFLEANKDNYNATDKIVYNQSDTNSAFIDAQLLASGNAVDLTSYDRVVIGIQKNDGYDVHSDCVVTNASGGKIEIPFMTQSLTTVGVNYFDITLYKGLSKLVSPKFIFRVSESMVSDKSIESSNEYSTLTAMISQVSEALDTSEKLISRVEILEKTVDSNEKTRVSNENVRVANEIVRVNSENSRVSKMNENQGRFDTMHASMVDKTNDFRTIKNEILQVKQDTSKVKDETTLVKNTTESLRVETLKVKNDTLIAKNDTLTVKNDTEKVRVATNTVKNEAEGKIVNVEGRMKVIEDSFDDLVAGTGFASILYVDNKVASVVDSAPTSLNTLKKVANSLNNDANFATTVMNQIGTKAQINDSTAATSSVWSSSKTKTEIDKKANSSHTHSKSQITDFSHRHDASDIDNISSSANNITYDKNGCANVDVALDKLFLELNGSKTALHEELVNIINIL